MRDISRMNDKKSYMFGKQKQRHVIPYVKKEGNCFRVFLLTI